MRHFPDEDARAYARGYADALQGRPYRQGFCTHRFRVVIPGCAFASVVEAGYRDGWLDGKAALMQ